MSSEVICPTCGRALKVDVELDSADPDVSSPAAHPIDIVTPTTVDGLEVRPVSHAPEPDPILGSMFYGSSDPDALPLQSSAEETELPRGEASDNGANCHESPPVPDALASLNLDAPRGFEREPSQSTDEFDSLDKARERPARWPLILLGSYASALTLACLWVVLAGRVHFRGTRPAEEATQLEASPSPENGERAGRSEKVAPAAPIPADHVTSLGHPLRMGSLEFTPLAVQKGPVRLERERLGQRSRERRDGGQGALVLRIRLRNLSNDAIFAPLDEAFIRERDRGFPESFIETGQNERIYIYPLAVQSEWSIAGQTFPVLKPGESAETVVVSAAESSGRASDPMIWRIRLRTGIEQTDVLGVRFRVAELGRDGR